MRPASLRLKFLDHELTQNVVYYTISVTDINSQKNTWFLKARYSRLLLLHEQISAGFQGNLPEFPPKKWIGNRNPNFLSQRKKHLENYFNTLLRTINFEKIAPLKEFLLEKLDKSFENERKSIDSKNLKDFKDIQRKEGIEQGGNSLLKATGGAAEKIVEFFSNKMVDIRSNTCFPEEEEVTKKKKLYLKLGGFKENSKLIEIMRLPKGTEKNLLGAKKESWGIANTANLNHLEEVMGRIKEKLGDLNGLLGENVIVHSFE